MLHFIYSAPADASAEEAAAHATGNGVASEVGGLHACTQSQFVLRLVLSVFFVDVLSAQFLVRLGNAHCFLFFLPWSVRPRVKLQVRMLTATATVMMTTTMSASPLET